MIWFPILAPPFVLPSLVQWDLSHQMVYDISVTFYVKHFTVYLLPA